MTSRQRAGSVQRAASEQQAGPAAEPGAARRAPASAAMEAPAASTTAVGHLAEIRISPESESARIESLVQCLAAILRPLGRSSNAADLACQLGTAVMTSHCAAARQKHRWNVYGRHAFLVEAGRELGLELRELHPPRAAPFPPAPPEFDAHWRDSYMPFVRSSLARGEAVLAWMGWPPPDEAAWGVITAVVAGDGGGATGQSSACGGRAVALVGSPVQAYCVTVTEPGDPSVDALLASVMRRFGLVLLDELPREFGASTGAAALEALCHEPNPAVRCAVLQQMQSSRAEAAEWLAHQMAEASGEIRATAQAIVDALRGQIALIEKAAGGPGEGEEVFSGLIESERRLARIIAPT